MKDITNDKMWNSALIDCVGGSIGAEEGSVIKSDQLNKAVSQNLIRARWNGNVYRYSFR